MEQTTDNFWKEKFVQLLRKANDEEEVYICDYCKNNIPCGVSCDSYECGTEATIDGKPCKFIWSCMDFDFGTCNKLKGTPCECCWKNGYSNFSLDETQCARD